DGRQFHTVTFKLDRHAHFPARVQTAHIRAAAMHPARRFRRAYLIDQHSSLITQIQPVAPSDQFTFIEHRADTAGDSCSPVFLRILSHQRADVEPPRTDTARSEEHTSELQSRFDLVCRLLLEKK